MEGGRPEADVSCGIEIKEIVLPDGSVKNNKILYLEDTVQEVKTRMLRRIGRTPNDYRMVFYNADGSTVELNDQAKFEKYPALLAQGADSKIEIVER